MALGSILDHIINEANSRKEKIIKAAKEERDSVIRAAKEEAEKLYREIMDKEKSAYSAQRQKLIVNGRLETKKGLLKAKQELIDRVFEKIKSGLGRNAFKKEEIRNDRTQEVAAESDFYLNQFKSSHESEIARILFG